MASLAIKGHLTRGSEVITLLEMLGGKNIFQRDGNNKDVFYYIDENRHIQITCGSLSYILFTLEQFEEKFPYKVGDKVITNDGDKASIVGMFWDNDIDDIFYETQICNEVFKYPKELLEPYKEETMGDKLNLLQQLKDYFDNTPREVIEKEWHQYDKYNEIGPRVNEYLEYVNNIRYPQYPKTYGECCEVLGSDPSKIIVLSNRKDIIHEENKHCYEMYNLYQLLICRGAYWKIAGEEMKLGKPWEPNWKDDSDKYFICYLKDELWMSNIRDCNRLLVFPTKEMRDAFYENFKELIENCKELL